MMAAMRNAICVVAIFVSFAKAAFATVLVTVPSELTTIEGAGANAFPFGANGVFSQRFQQVYAASQFSGLGGPLTITEISFRPNFNENPFSYTLPDVEIFLSATTVAPDSLSTTFASNVGSNNQVVYDGPITFSTASGPSIGPRDFDFNIQLQTPFYYDPSLGNLLMDVRRIGAAPIAEFFDYTNVEGDSVSRVYTNNTFPNGVNSTIGQADSGGLVTRFTAATIPEPSSMAIFWLGSLLLAVQRRKLSEIR